MSLSHPPRQLEPAVPPGDATALLARLRGFAEPNEPLHADLAERPTLHLQEAYRLCVGITRRHSRSFFFSTQLLPREKRLSIRALYAFCRTSDDLVDQPGQDAVRALAGWVARVHTPAPSTDDAVLLAWRDTAARYAVPSWLTDELLAGVAMDLTVNRYATFDDLWLYCYRVASVVGLISMQIIGARHGASRFAITLGVALQLTNILRDVGEDAERGRVYLPQEDLERFGLRDDDILDGHRNPSAWAQEPRFRALMRYEIARAYRLYDEAWPGIALLNPDGQLAVGAAAEIYRGILAKVVANDYDVFSKRAFVPLSEKLLILSRVWRRLRSDRNRSQASVERGEWMEHPDHER